MNIFTAIDRGQIDKVVQSGISLNTRDRYGYTPLMAFNHDPSIIKILLLNGADVDTINYIGQTALIRAIIDDKPVVAKLLLDAGADMCKKDIHGNTAFSYAMKSYNLYMLYLLAIYGKCD